MRRATIALITLALLFGTRLHAQNIMDVKHVIEKSFNYGAKLGINASFPVIHELSINDVDAENMLIDYQVGWEATLFCRFNLNRFFLQPNVTWSKTSAQMRFLIPDQPEQVDLSGQTNTILRIDTRQETRNYGFKDACSRQVLLDETIYLPKDYALETPARKDTFEGKTASFEGYVKQTGKQIKLHHELRLNKRVYEAGDWNDFRKAINLHKAYDNYFILKKRDK